MKFYLTFISVIATLCATFAAGPNQIGYLGIENGLSNNIVRCIYQDHKGFMWFGTRDGLNRYDGYNFKVFRNTLNDTSSLINNIVQVIAQDRSHQLWVGTRQGVSVYNDLNGRFVPVRYLPTKEIRPLVFQDVTKDIIEDSKGNMLIATEGRGLMMCKAGSVNTALIPLSLNGKNTNSYGVQSIRMDQNGKVWAFVQNFGLCLLDDKGLKLNIVSNAVTTALYMAIITNGIYLGTPNGLYHFEVSKNKMEKITVSKDGKESAISSITSDLEGQLWLGTVGNGIYVYSKNKGSFRVELDREGSERIKGSSIYAVFVDKSRRKWIGSSLGGINIIDPNKKGFLTISHNQSTNSLVGNAVTCFFEEKPDRIWIGTEGLGLSIWDRKSGFFSNFSSGVSPSSLSSNSITSIVRDGNDIWVATFSEGLNKTDQNAINFRRYRCIDPKTGIESNVVYSLLKDKNGDFYAGTLRRGSLFGALYKYNRPSDRFELFDAGLSDLFIMKEDRNGTLWGGNLNSLIAIDRSGKRAHRFYKIGFSIRAIYEDEKGNFYIGTEGGGIFLFDRKLGKVTKQFSSEQGLCNNAVLSIIDDHQGNFWLSTYNGISKFDVQKQTFKNYYQSDGLQSNQFQVNAGIRLSNGDIAFGGIKGFNIFTPSMITQIADRPKLLLTGLKVNNQQIEDRPELIKNIANDQIMEISIPYREAVLSLDYTALEYSSPDKIRYSYFMDGWDRNWSAGGTSRSASYTHLEEGTYIFRVKSTNTEGVWGKQEIDLKITVLPPWYRTWWAYFIYLSGILALVYVYNSYRSRQNKLKYEVKLLALESEKKKVEYERAAAVYEKEKTEHEKQMVLNEKEKELNEKRISFFTNISHEFRSPLSLIINPVRDLIDKYGMQQQKGSEELNIIYRNAKRMLSLVDQLLLFRKTDSGAQSTNFSRIKLYELCDEVFLCFVQQAANKQLTYQFICEPKDLTLFADREKLEIIIFNLISNALKYTPAGGKVTLSVIEGIEEVTLVVEDTGIGIPALENEKVFERFYQPKRSAKNSKPGFGIGLYLAKQFADTQLATLNFTSQEGIGTVFSLILKKGTEHLPENVGDELEHSESILLTELAAADIEEQELDISTVVTADILSDKQSILIVDDEADIRQYISKVLKESYLIYEANSGEDGLVIAAEKLPDLIITDFRMQGIDGIEFCMKIKSDPTLSYIPVILLTGSSSNEIRLKSMEGGADEYISKPFEKEYLIARIANLLRNRNSLQNYFYNEITLQNNSVTVSQEYKNFLDKCILVVEQHLNDPNFGIKVLSDELGMSHSNLYKRVKSISGQSVTAFIRFIRLRKAAELMIGTGCNVSEAAFASGFNDSKYFGKQFQKVFGINPSEFIRKHRSSFSKRYKLR